VYWFLSGIVIEGLPLLFFLAASVLGSWFLLRSLFNLPAFERPLLSVALGVCLGTWLSNFTGRILAPQAGFMLSALIILVAGCSVWILGGRGKPEKQEFTGWPLLVAVLAMTLVFTLMGRGLGIFDDRKNLSMISIMAAGDIPPHFYMNAGFLFKYHYGFELLAAMVMRLGGLFPWSAFDLTKGAVAGMALGLAALWGRRVGGRWSVGIVLAFVLAMADGGRWLLTLLPVSWVAQASRHITMWGSGFQSGETLVHALNSAWAVEGGPPFPLPFAFANGILQPFILYLQAGPRSLLLVIIFCLLLLVGRQSARYAWLIFVPMLALLALAAEAEYILFCAGLVIILAVLPRRRLTISLRRQSREIFGAAGLSAVLGLVQGGTITETMRGVLQGASGSAAAAGARFGLRFPPAIVSSHLGELRLTSPGELMLGLFELGPALLLAPLVILLTLRWLTRGRYLWSAMAASTFLGFLIPIFLRYQVDRDITRMTVYALMGWIILATPALAAALRCGRRPWLAGALCAYGMLLVFGGLVLAGPLLTAANVAVIGSELAPADASMTRQVWDRLPPEALVLDSSPWRAVVVTGRLTISSSDSDEVLPSWRSLVANPVIGQVRQAGFDYVYIDTDWLNSMPPQARLSYAEPCARSIAEVHDSGANGGRWLYDISTCRGGPGG
jgi:hypothetical protein